MVYDALAFAYRSLTDNGKKLCLTRSQHVRRPLAERLESRELLAVDLVKDINVFNNVNGSNPTNFAEVNGTAYFAAQTDGYGIELWKSGGTEASTVLVQDIVGGLDRLIRSR